MKDSWANSSQTYNEARYEQVVIATKPAPAGLAWHPDVPPGDRTIKVLAPICCEKDPNVWRFGRPKHSRVLASHEAI